MDPISMSASLITILALIVQTVDAVRKSHELYSSVKDAPEKLRLLLDELQMLNNLLVASQETALHRSDQSLSGFLTALAYCRDALESVRAFSTDLENSILRAKRGLRQWATVKVVFLDRKLKRHLNRLERAKSMLSLAHQMCMQSQMSHVTQLQKQMMLMPPDYITAVSESIEPRASVLMSTSIEQATRPSEPDHEKHLHQGSNLSRRRDMSSYNCVFGNLYISWTDSDYTPEDGQNDQEVQQIVFRSHANRFLSRNFSLLCERSFGAWKISLRSVSNFRIDDPLYRYCASGDLSGIQRLFRSRKASPSDMTHHGYTPLHIAAAFGNAETCRFLLAQGADADAAATSEWVREVGSETMLIFEAGSTPLQIAADCSGRWVHGDIDFKITELLPVSSNSTESKQCRWSSAFLDTIRVLVENGGDPMASNARGDTALHVHTGASQQFQYLLHQEHYAVDCTHLNHHGDTVAEQHVRRYWSHGPVRTRLALEHEDSQKRNSYRNGPSRPWPLPVTSATLLLHDTASHLRHFLIHGSEDFEGALQLVQVLVKEGVDLHDAFYRGLERQKTPLARIVDIANEFDSSSEALELQHDITNRVIDEWLRTLDAAGVDLQQYVDEEERLVRFQDDDRQWEPYLYDDGLEYQVKWYWRDSTDDRCCPVSVRYVWRHAPNQPEEMGSWQCDGFTVPGGWVEEDE